MFPATRCSWFGHPQVTGPPGVPSDPYVAQCAGKHWWGEPFSEPGLHFACGACVQIVPVDYSDFLDQDLPVFKHCIRRLKDLTIPMNRFR